MIVIPPMDCTAPGVLVSTNAVNLAAWAAGTTYAADAQCSYNQRNWISVQSDNLGKTPGTDKLWWIDHGPINTLAMFDNSVQTATERTGGLSWTLSVGRFTALALMGLRGQRITITIKHGATVIQAETRTLATSTGTYYNFSFEAPFQTDAATFSGLLSSLSCTVTISIAAAPAQVSACGLCVIGKQFFVGDATHGFSTPIEDRGRHYLDSSDNPVNVERGYSKGASGTIVTKKANYNRLLAFLADHIGEPMVWVATPDDNDFVAANVFGRYVRAVPVIDNPVDITLALDISGYR